MGSGTWPDKPYDSPPTSRETDGFYRVVLVSGSRSWEDYAVVADVLDFIRPKVLIHGAATGLDTMADTWARHEGVIIEPHKVSQGWYDTYGKQAPLVRNTHMVMRADEWEAAGHKVLVIGFPLPGSTGTWDLLRKATSAELLVLHK